MNDNKALFRVLLALALTTTFAAGCEIKINGETGGAGGSGGAGGGAGGAGGEGGGGTWISTTGPEHCGKITGDEVWAADKNPHVVTCDVLLEGGSLRVGPGTEVVFAADTALKVSEGGGTADLEVAGDAANPVSFRSQTGEAPGLWAGLTFDKAAGQVSLRHVSIDSAGGFNTAGAVEVHGADIHVDHVTISRSEEYGLYFRQLGGLTPESTGLVIKDTEGYPVIIDPDRADSLPAEDSAYSGNTEDVIVLETKGSGQGIVHITGPRTWEDLGVPYFAVAPLSLNGSATKPAVLTLLSGVTILFSEDSGIAGGTDGAAGLVTQGTPDRPVTLTSAGGEVRGAWSGIEMGDNTSDADFRLENTIIEYGGGFNNISCLALTDTSVLVKNVTLRGCEEGGFYFWDHAFFQDGSSGLSIHDADHLGEMWAFLAHTVPEEGIDHGELDDEALIVTYGHSQAVEGEVTWGDIGVPYRAETGVLLAGTVQKPSVLNLVPGIQVQFGLDGFLSVGKGGAGAVRALGTPDKPILLTGASAADPGAWGGVEIDDLAIDAETVFDNVVIEYGGGKNSVANVEITGAAPTIKSSIIRYSDEWGIYVWSGPGPVLTDVTFVGNPAGDVGSL